MTHDLFSPAPVRTGGQHVPRSILEEHFQVVLCPRDGHCLVHAFSVHVGLSSTEICEYVKHFVNDVNVIAHYSQFIRAVELSYGLNRYINQKLFNSTFCDILPRVLSDCFNVFIVIVFAELGSANLKIVTFKRE